MKWHTLLLLLFLSLLNISQRVTHAAAPAATITVNYFGDVSDPNLADGVCDVGFGLCTLRAALENANIASEPTTILFDLPPATTLELTNGPLLVLNEIVIDGSDSQNVIVEPQSGERAFHVHSTDGAVTINDLIVTQAQLTGLGGAVVLANGDLTLSNMFFSQNVSDDCGGAVRVENGMLTVVDSDLVFGSAENGGAICAVGGQVNLIDTLVNNNSADEQGGAIHLTNAQLTTNNITFDNNDSSQNCGGAIYAEDSAVTIDNSLFTWNASSSHRGGALCLESAETLITASQLSHNTALLDGGGIYIDGGTVTIDNSTVNDNESQTEWGGAIYATATDLTITHSTFDSNKAAVVGGVNTYGHTTFVSDSIFSNNESDPHGGGGLAILDGTVHVERTQFLDNRADSGGGGLIAVANGLARDLYFEGNTAQTGGGAIAIIEPEGVDVPGILIERATFYDNIADHGGAMVLVGDTIIQNSTFNNNLANRGGAIYAADNYNYAINHTTIAFNNAIQAGGGIYLDEIAVLQVENSIVASNVNGDCYVDQFAILQAAGANLASDNSCAFFSHPNENPLLDGLTDNGGFAPTLMPSPASPAINVASPGGCNAVNHFDQRGYARNDGACDLGAVEVDAVPLAVTLRSATVRQNNWLGFILIAVIMLIVATNYRLSQKAKANPVTSIQIP